MENLIIKIGSFVFLLIFLCVIISTIIHIVKGIFDKNTTAGEYYSEYLSALRKNPETTKFFFGA